MMVPEGRNQNTMQVKRLAYSTIYYLCGGSIVACRSPYYHRSSIYPLHHAEEPIPPQAMLLMQSTLLLLFMHFFILSLYQDLHVHV